MLKTSFQRAQEARAAQRAAQAPLDSGAKQEMCDDFGNGFLAILSECTREEVTRVLNTNAGICFMLGGMAETGCLTDDVITAYGLI
jgi:hypothetical protein